MFTSELMCRTSRIASSALRTMSSEAKAKLEALQKKAEISIARADDNKAFTIKLNKQTLKTPMKKLLLVPDETLALAIANEWKINLGKKKIDLPNMHLTTLAYTAVDNPFDETKESIIEAVMEYLKFDTVRFRDVENEELLRKQSRHWDPLIGWFEHKFNCHLPIEYGDIASTDSIPDRTHEVITRHLISHNHWPLVGINYMARNLKSLVITTSLTERFLSVEKAVELARLETRHQVERWSKVEWEHDLDEQCTNARVAAGTLFYHLTV